MIHAVCTKDSWAELLGNIEPRQRFFEPASVDAVLAEQNGYPVLFVVGEVRIHFYPPIGTGNWATALIQQGKDY